MMPLLKAKGGSAIETGWFVEWMEGYWYGDSLIELAV